MVQERQDAALLMKLSKASPEMESYLNAVFNNTGDPIFVKDSDCRLLMVNDAFCQIFSLPRELIIGKTLAEKVPVDEREHFLSVDYQVLADGKEVVCEETLTTGGEQTRTILTRKNRFEDLNGNYFLVGVIHDITTRKQSEENLKLAASVFSHSREEISITDVSGNIIDVNEAFTRISGFTRSEVLGRNPRFLQSGRQPPSFYADMWNSLTTDGYWSGEMWNRRKSGEVYAVMKTISAVRDNQGDITHYVALGTDITAMKMHQEELEHIAHYDILTNLPNRSLLADRLSQSMLQCKRHKKSLAVVFLDLDEFKAVNDSYGHDIGDELLILFSKRMQIALREVDNIARIGGDEFVAVLTDLHKVKDCEPVLQRLLLAASEPITINGVVINISASIGVTFYPQDDVGEDLLMRHADQAMYTAKELGKNRYHIFSTLENDALKEQLQSLTAISFALKHRQFELYYQPKVNMKTSEVIGAEALIRWNHPKRGLLSPNEFLPSIENNAISIDLGDWVISTAISQISQWQKMEGDFPFVISVNVSAVQLLQSNFSKKLATQLAVYPDVNPAQLELEILETSALDDMQHVSKIMQDCIKLGVNFSIDDFGTGYSSLTYLSHLPAHLIKIDQSFVRNMLVDSDDLAIVEGVIALAKSLKRKVIAEGVETIEHGIALLNVGCDLAQGYSIAKPMPAKNIPAWIRSWTADENWFESSKAD